MNNQSIRRVSVRRRLVTASRISEKVSRSTAAFVDILIEDDDALFLNTMIGRQPIDDKFFARDSSSVMPYSYSNSRWPVC